MNPPHPNPQLFIQTSPNIQGWEDMVCTTLSQQWICAVGAKLSVSLNAPSQIPWKQEAGCGGQPGFSPHLA